MPDPSAQYTFVPWLRQGIAARITEADHLGISPGAGANGRAGLAVDVALESVPVSGGDAVPLATLAHRVQLLGPGDILGLKPKTIMRTSPYPDSPNATPGELAFVEFYEEDFPWRYTPARAATAGEDAFRRHKLRPWIVLLVLRPEEFTLSQEPGELGVLSVKDGVALPPPDETWAWAHAQITGAVASAADVGRAIAANPDGSLARLMSPRKLDPEASYEAFVVPGFETGRLAGLKLRDPGTPAQKPSWGTTATGRQFPVYFSWRFKTGRSGDFESLARALAAHPVGPSFGKRKMDISDMGFGMPTEPASVDLEGALRATTSPQAPDSARVPFPQVPGSTIAEQLRAVINLSQDLQDAKSVALPNPLSGPQSAYAPMLRPDIQNDVPDDPIVTPPDYGRHHARVDRIPEVGSTPDLEWLTELNLDPRSRAAAGLGAQVIAQLQDDLMERAWKQVGEIEAANDRLRKAELASAASEAIYGKHVRSAGAGRVLTLTSAAHAGLPQEALSGSLQGLISDSRIPDAALSATFKRVSRPQRKIMRRLTGTGRIAGVQDGLLIKMNLDASEALSTAPPRSEAPVAVALVQVSSALTDSLTAASTKQEPKLTFLELLRDDLSRRRTANEDIATLPVSTLRASLGTALTRATGTTPAAQAFATAVRALIQAILQLASDGPDGAVVTLDSGVFAAEFGAKIAGKSYRGVTVVSAAPAPDAEIARTASIGDVEAYREALGAFGAAFIAGRPLPAPAPALSSVDALGDYVASSLQPRVTLTRRVALGLEGLTSDLDARPLAALRPLRPVMAHPVYDDPMFEPLSKLSREFILPNVSDLPRDSITLLEPNTGFIEAYLAGLNTELGRELLWRGFPTDRRGTYMRTFWDTRDAIGHAPRADIKPMHEWTGSLGDQSILPSEKLVLVIRGELLQKYPNTLVYAQEAIPSGSNRDAARMPDPTGVKKYPAFHATIEPDIAIYGFDLSQDAARGHRRVGPSDPERDRPGWFFVLKERPGQVRFGADDAIPAAGFGSWDDLAWDRIPLSDGLYARAAGAGLPAPADPAGVLWGGSAAHVAYALFQSPVIYARHASELLPGR